MPPTPRPSSRTRFVVWLRQAHGWIGLWGATLGLLFGTSGIWLNHRAVLKLEPALERSDVQLKLPDPAPRDAQALAGWLQATLDMRAPPSLIRVEPARPVAWAERAGGGDGARAGQRRRGGDDERSRSRDGERGAPMAAPAPVDPPAASAPAPLMQPEHWTINFAGPQLNVQTDYWVGNRSVAVRRAEGGVIATLMNLHKGVGMPVPWILLVDTLAGGLILLSLSGLTLWMLTRRTRTVGLTIFGVAFAVTVGLAVSHL